MRSSARAHRALASRRPSARAHRALASRRPSARGKRSVEYSILYTATLCLLAAGAVMVYSASSAESLQQGGDAAGYLKRYLIFGSLGLVAMHVLSRRSLTIARNATPLILAAGFALTLAGLVPGGGGAGKGAPPRPRARA